jgi:hypothetical protein
MPDIVNNDIIRVTAKMLWGGGQIQNVFHVEYSGTTQDDVDFMDDVSLMIDTSYMLLQTHVSNAVVTETFAYYNISQDRPMGEQSWPNLAGFANSTGEHLAPQLAPLVLFSTYVSKSQGRKYLPFFTTNNTSNYGEVDATPLAAMVTWGSTFLGSVSLTVGSITFGNWNDNLTRFAPWVEVFAKNRLHTQRRRRASVGS